SLGSEASYAAGGILAPQAEADRVDDFFKLACQSRDLYPALASELLAETGTDIELDRAGTLYLAFTESDLREIERRFEWQARAGLLVDRLSATEARRLDPSIAANVRAALLFSNDIQVDNRRLLSALIAANRKLGVRLITDTNVDSVRTESNRIGGVETSKGFVSTSRVVMAAGAWTSLISTNSGQHLPRIQVEPVRGQMLCFQTNPRLARHILYSPRGYLVPRLDGRILAGSTTEHAGYAKEVTAGGVQEILSHAFEIAPALGSLEISGKWAGLRPRAEDDLPVLGPCEIEGLFYATGHYRNGILLAPVTGLLIAEAIGNNVISPLLSRFAPDRFDLVGAR
ncbi:MAG: glycine oxidase ThiO, partial [Acidobacteriota bacterium]|nr:glycine oxidase ThiO [Acidobacteriota bacterium]